MSLLLGIDVGTGGTRALVVDEHGGIVASATAEHAPFASPQTGWAEQDPHDWWRAAREAVHAVLKQPGVSADAIAAIGFSGQMHGSTLLDAHDEVVRPALLWCDQRTDRQCQQITETIGAARLIELTLNPALTGFTPPKMLWVREHEPGKWRDVRSVLLPKDYVRFRLTGQKATDVADASGTLLFDVGARNWSDTVLRALDLKASLMPEAFESPMITGSVSTAGARGHGAEGRHAGRRRRRRPGRWRRRHGHRAGGRRQRHHRHLRRRLCRHRSARARTGRPHPHVLPRRARPLARDGRHAGRRPVVALVPRPVRRRGR